jgi:hypoxanthine phosphoribosyltransferase
MQVFDKEFTLFISSEAIQNRINTLADELSANYAGKDPLFIVLLNGAFMFAADLIKNISLPCQVCFIKISSYQGMHSTGSVKQILGMEDDIENRHIIILDDIVDTGLTMKSVMQELVLKNPASIEVATLLLKPETFGNQFDLTYVGFTIPNDFVVGYGLDYNGYGRNLKDIYHFKD